MYRADGAAAHQSAAVDGMASNPPLCVVEYFTRRPDSIFQKRESCRRQFKLDGWRGAASSCCLQRAGRASPKDPPTIHTALLRGWRMEAAPAFQEVIGRGFQGA